MAMAARRLNSLCCAVKRLFPCFFQPGLKSRVMTGVLKSFDRFLVFFSNLFDFFGQAVFVKEILENAVSDLVYTAS